MKKTIIFALIFLSIVVHAQSDSAKVEYFHSFIGKPIKTLIDSMNKHDNKIVGRIVLTRSGIVFCGYWLKFSDETEIKLYVSDLKYIDGPAYYLKNEKKNYRLFFRESLSDVTLVKSKK